MLSGKIEYTNKFPVYKFENFQKINDDGGHMQYSAQGIKTKDIIILDAILRKFNTLFNKLIHSGLPGQYHSQNLGFNSFMKKVPIM